VWGMLGDLYYALGAAGLIIIALFALTALIQMHRDTRPVNQVRHRKATHAALFAHRLRDRPSHPTRH